MPQIPFFAKEWRQFRNLKLTEAAALAEMPVSDLSILESRERHFDEHDLAALANAYKIHPAMFFNLNPSDPADREVLEKALAAWESD
jgi:hypothetical protein